MQVEDASVPFPGFVASLSNSNSGSLHRSDPAPVIPLAPTVGSQVVLTPKHFNRDAFIWEDREMDLLYLQSAIQHMIVGTVVRETDKHFVVRLPIPYHCLPPAVCGRNAKKHPREGKDEGDAGSKNDNGRDEQDGAHNGGDGIEKNAAVGDDFLDEDYKSTSAVNVVSPREGLGGADAAGGVVNNFHSRSTRFVAGIVPVLVVTHEIVSVSASHNRTNAAQSSKDNNSNEKLQTDLINVTLPSPSSHLTGSTPSQSTGAQTLSSVHFTNENPRELFYVSLSVAKSSCTSVLQSLLEQDNKLECVSAAVGKRDFKLAARHVIQMIEGRRNAIKQQKGVCKNMMDPLQSSLRWVQSDSQPSCINADCKTDDLLMENCSSRFNMILRRDKECSSFLEFQSLLSGFRNEKEQRQGSKGNDSDAKLPSTDVADLESVAPTKLQALQIIWEASNAKKELAPLYTLLSFLHFQDGQYERSLEDAVEALAYDGKCIEAYVRAMAGFMALGSEQGATVTGAAALRSCLALSPQFARLSRIASLSAFCHRNLGPHDAIDVSPRLSQPTKDAAAFSGTNQLSRRTATVRVRGLNYSFTTPASLFCVPSLSQRNLLTGSSPSMDYFVRNLRARAARGFEQNEIIFSEEVSLQVLLWTLISREDGTSKKTFSNTDSEIADVWMSTRSRYCAYCGHPLVPRSVLLLKVRERISRAMADHVRWDFNEKRPVPCLAGCGDHYCDEICRNRAALEYHWMECSLLPMDESETKKKQVLLQDCFFSGDTEKSWDVLSSTLLTSPLTSDEDDGTHTSFAEFFPLATSPHQDPSYVRNLVNICRHFYMQQNCLDFVDFPAGAHERIPRRNSLLSSSTEAMRDHERLYLNTVQTCCSALPQIRLAFNSYYASVYKFVQEGAPNAVIAALLVAGRLVASTLSLIIPTSVVKADIALRGETSFIWSECGIHERLAAVKAIVSRYVGRGFTSSAVSLSDRHDHHGLCLAEEVLQQIRVPFFADTNLHQPSTVWEILNESPKVNDTQKEDASNAAVRQSFHRGFGFLLELLRAIDDIVQSRLRDAVVAFSLPMSSDPPNQMFASRRGSVTGAGVSRAQTKSQSDCSRADTCGRSGNGGGGVGERNCGQRPSSCQPLLMDVGSVAVWLIEERSKAKSHLAHHPSPWTIGRLLVFLGKRRFMEQFWDFCVSSYCVVPKCVLSVGADENIPEHHKEEWEEICSQYTVLVAVMGPLTSVVTDLSVFAGNSCSRFYKDATPNSQRNPLYLRKGDSPAMSMLSINSLTYEPDEIHAFSSEYRASSHQDSQFSVKTSLSNLELCGKGAFNGSGNRCVTMRARRSITIGEELRYENNPS